MISFSSKKHPFGFTLIELLVVVAILAILGVVSVSLYGNAQKAAKDAQKKTDLNTISKIYESYYDVNSGKYLPPPASEFPNDTFPIPPDNTSYSGTVSAAQAAFQVCIPLSSYPGNSCNSPSQTCFCKQSLRGDLSSIGVNTGTYHPPTCDPNGTLDDGLIGWWKMDENTGITVQSSISGGINGTFFNGEYGTADVGTTNTLLKETSNYALNYSSNYYNGWTLKATSGLATGNSTTISSYTVFSSQNNKEATFSSSLSGFTSGNTYHLYYGTDETGPEWSTGGKLANALYFDGNDDYVGLGNAFYSSSGQRNNFTISAWINPDNVTGGKYIFIKNGPVYFYLNGSSLIGTFYNGTSAFTTTSNTGVVSAGTWKHVVFTYDGSKIRLYVGGSTVQEANASGTPGSNGYAAIGIYNNGGQNGGTSSPFKGYIDDLRFYNRALSGPEVEALYNNDSGCTP